MRKLKTFLLSVALLSTTFYASAHALWIETATAGKAGRLHTVKLFFGEYAEDEREPLSNWQSDLKDLELWLTKPDGSREKLTINPDSNFLHTSFVPSEDGVYILSTAHKLGDLNGSTQLEFSAQSAISIGKTTGDLEEGLDHEGLHVFPLSSANPMKWKVNKAAKLKAVHNGTVKSEGIVTVLSPLAGPKYSRWAQTERLVLLQYGQAPTSLKSAISKRRKANTTTTTTKRCGRKRHTVLR